MSKITVSQEGFVFSDERCADKPAYALSHVLAALARYDRVVSGEIRILDSAAGIVLIDYRTPRKKDGVAVVAVFLSKTALIKASEADPRLAPFVSKAKDVSEKRPFLVAFTNNMTPVLNWGGWRGWQVYAALISLLRHHEVCVAASAKAAKAAWERYRAALGNTDEYVAQVVARRAWKGNGGAKMRFTIATEDGKRALNKAFPSIDAALAAARAIGWRTARVIQWVRGDGGWRQNGEHLLAVDAK